MATSLNQWDAVYPIKGSSYPNVGGTLADSVNASEYISGNTEDYSYSSYARTFLFISNEVALHSNFVELAAGYYDSNGNRTGGHMVAMNGEDDSGTLEYLDPWDNTHYQCKYTAFCNGSFNGWRYDVTVYNMES
jgi:3-deoxy-D-arabino-heptulosonate 7-phosphate (DAHP) synthase class II